MAKIDTLPSVECPICGKTFLRRHTRHIYCSKQCYRKAGSIAKRNKKIKEGYVPVKDRPPIVCPMCGKVFSPNHCKQKYCCHRCSDKAFVIAYRARQSIQHKRNKEVINKILKVICG